MGDLTKNFSRSEFACKDGCGRDAVDFVLVSKLQAVRDHPKVAGRPIRVISGNRCPYWNGWWQGAIDSQHMHHKAADIWVIGMTKDELAEVCREIGFSFVKTYDDRKCVHVDVR